METRFRKKRRKEEKLEEKLSTLITLKADDNTDFIHEYVIHVIILRLITFKAGDNINFIYEYVEHQEQTGENLMTNWVGIIY